MKNPLVSVIIPVYNGEKTIEKCLYSVLTQDYPNLEIIVVDNNSTDNTKKIINDFSRKDKRIKYAFEKKRGGGYVRNTGIKKARGEIIAMIDADCIAPQNWITELIKPILFENEKIVMGSEINNSNNYWAKNIQKSDIEFYKKNQTKDDYINFLDSKNFAIQLSIAKKIMFDNEFIDSADFGFYLKLKKYGLKIKFLPHVKVYHPHPETFKRYFKKQLERGYWSYQVYKKYKKYSNLKKEETIKNFNVKNFLLFPLWFFLQFFKRPIKEIPFLFVKEISWRLGIIKNIIDKNLINKIKKFLLVLLLFLYYNQT